MKIKFVGWALAHRPDCCDQIAVRLMPRGLSLAGVLWVVVVVVIVLLLALPKILYRHPPDGNLREIAQLKTIDTVLELFKSEFDYYPPSDALDQDGTPYCGAMKLCEAAMGKDLMGVHPKTVFRSDGTDGKGTMLYLDANDLSKLSKGVYWHDLSVRRGPYLPIETANAYRLGDLYEDVGPFDANTPVLCDVWRRVTHLGTGRKVGMPILYYKADTSKAAHDINDPNNPENIYDYRDNHTLLALGVPGKPGQKHPLFENPRMFYEMTRDYRATTANRPLRADTYILLSAGWDGLYGTKDDITNFDMRWKPK